MSAEQIRDWSTQGIEFGAHSRTHADLTTLTSEALEEEVLGSGNDLTSLLGSRVVSFAYPYGYYNQEVLDRVRGAFDCAFIADDTIGGMNDLGTGIHLLQRTMVQRGESAMGVECRARWGRNPFQDLRYKLRLRTRLKRGAHFIFGKAR
jgi:peptidoglycan/xylan/chitin deacetylase (PgdA/CDA1 family)